MVRLEVPYYELFSVLLSSDQRAWGASVILRSTPTCPQDRGICFSRASLPLIHPSFPSRPEARPFPLASLQHNGLAALRFHDTPPPDAVRAFALSNAGSHFHTVWTPGEPSAPLTTAQAQARPTDSWWLLANLEPDPWEGDLEAAVLGGDGAGGGGGVIHSCWRKRFLPSNWPWARQQVVSSLGQKGVG